MKKLIILLTFLSWPAYANGPINCGSGIGCTLATTGTTAATLPSGTHTLAASDNAVFSESIDLIGIGTTGGDPSLILENTSGATPTAFGPSVIFKNHVSGKNPFTLSQYQSTASDFAIANFNSPFQKWLDIDQSGNVTIVSAFQGPNLTLSGNQINEYTTNALAEVAINFAGYNGGTTQFRDLEIFNGKNSTVARFIGTTNTLYVPSGSIGIGTSSPIYPLQVIGNVGASTFIPTANVAIPQGLSYLGGNELGIWENTHLNMILDGTSDLFLGPSLETAASPGYVPGLNGGAVFPHLNLQSGDGNAGMIVNRWTNDSVGSFVGCTKNRAAGVTAIGTPVIIQTGDSICNFTAQGYTGTQWLPAANILMAAEGTIGSTFVPGNILLQTSNSSGTLTTAVTINSSQNVGIGTASPATKLDVNGDITMETGTAGAMLCLTAAHALGHCTAAASCTGTCTCTCAAN